MATRKSSARSVAIEASARTKMLSALEEIQPHKRRKMSREPKGAGTELASNVVELFKQFNLLTYLKTVLSTQCTYYTKEQCKE